MDKPEEYYMKASDRLRQILDQATTGDVTPMMRGIGISQRGKVELFARLAYISGIKRALEIVEDFEMEGSDGSQPKD
jgi:hypothetical protein